jgi:hypothetical protein
MACFSQKLLLGILCFYLNNTHILLHITSFSAGFFSF